jgi:hypothetical protein
MHCTAPQQLRLLQQGRRLQQPGLGLLQQAQQRIAVSATRPWQHMAAWRVLGQCLVRRAPLGLRRSRWRSCGREAAAMQLACACRTMTVSPHT